MRKRSIAAINANILKEYVKKRIAESLEAIEFKVPEEYIISTQSARDIEWMNEEVLGSNLVDFFKGRSVDYAKKNKAFSEGELFGDDVTILLAE